MKRKIEFLRMMDGQAVRMATYVPDSKPKAIVQIIHGFGEHIGQYESLISEFLSYGYICIIHDQRGFGQLVAHKKSLRGVTDSYEDWLSDIAEIRLKIKKDFQELKLPVILFGHSLGGNIALNYLSRRGFEYDKAVIESPWLGLYKGPAAFLTPIARNVGKMSSKIAVPTGLNMKFICHDQELAKAVANDGLFHSRLSLKLYAQIVEAADYAMIHAKAVRIPTLVMMAEDDHIISVDRIREFVAQSDDNVRLHTISEAYHVMHIDDKKAEFFAKVREFIEETNKEKK